MRISDWSSDVCSSDLAARGRIDEAGDGAQQGGLAAAGRAEKREELARRDVERGILDGGKIAETDADAIKGDGGCHGKRKAESDGTEIGRASCRERVCQYV